MFQTLCLCDLRAQGGNFILPQLWWHRAPFTQCNRTKCRSVLSVSIGNKEAYKQWCWIKSDVKYVIIHFEYIEAIFNVWTLKMEFTSRMRRMRWGGGVDISSSANVQSIYLEYRGYLSTHIHVQVSHNYSHAYVHSNIPPLPFYKEGGTPSFFFGGGVVCLGFIIPHENCSLIWRRHHYRWRAENFNLCSALIANEQWGFLNLPHLLWHWASAFKMIFSENP